MNYALLYSLKTIGNNNFTKEVIMLPGPMRAKDFTCLYCGSKLELTIKDVHIGENRGSCPMCSEDFCLKIDKEDMEQLLEAEEIRPA